MANKKTITKGTSDFREIIETNAYYVDKSLFIEEIITNSDKVILIPRPRRFGKTLNMSMLSEYFDIAKPDNDKLFKDLKIWQCSDEIKAARGKYPVIFISLRNAKGASWNDCYGQIKIEILKLFQAHRYLLDSAALYEEEKIKFKKILTETANDADYQNSLGFLSDYLHRHYSQKVLVLMDEYDAPIQSAYGKYYEDAIDFMRVFMSGAFKDNPNLYKGVITGIMRVSRESIFSGLNNIGVFTILQNNFADKFGFTEEEVKELIRYAGLDDALYNEVREWYDGYKFGNIDNIYNPWSVLSFIISNPLKFREYWANTSSNDLIKEEIKNKKNAQMRSEILKLINGETINKTIEENFTFKDIQTRKNLIWTLFWYSGYITITEEISRKRFALKIPNYEIATIFQDTVKEWFEEGIKVGGEVEYAIDALVQNDLKTFEQKLKKIVLGVFSYYDTAKDQEYIYHAYLLGLFAFASDEYIVKSNRESGEGRYDIMLVPRNKQRNKNGIVIEIKSIEKQKESEDAKEFQKRINGEIKKALNQINRNKYYTELVALGMKESDIIKVPIVFAGKEPFVNEQLAEGN